MLRAVSALELIQACALVHDDLMDASALRRGRPDRARRVRTQARRGGLARQARAVRCGRRDPARRPRLVWADDMFHTCGLSHGDARQRGRPVARRCAPSSWAASTSTSSHQATRDASPGRGTAHRPLQDRCLHRRTAAAPRRGARGRRSRSWWTATVGSAPTSASPSSSATTCWACSATRPSPASPRATTCGRASARCCWRRVRTRRSAGRQRRSGRPSRRRSAIRGSPLRRSTARVTCSSSWAPSRPSSSASPRSPAPRSMRSPPRPSPIPRRGVGGAGRHRDPAPPMSELVSSHRPVGTDGEGER